MHGVKVRISRTQKALFALEKQMRDQLARRIASVGYEPDDVFAVLPVDNPATRNRLTVLLEYEELKNDCSMSAITEIQYACALYPTVIMRYLHYLLDNVGVPPVEELDIYRDMILRTSSEQEAEFVRLERRWQACALS